MQNDTHINEMPTRIKLSKEEVNKISVGDKVKIEVHGVVTGVSSNNNYGTPVAIGDKAHKSEIQYEVELKGVSSKLNVNKADEALKEMSKKEKY